MSKISEKLQEFRKKHNLSKSDLAKALHVSPAYITMLENGKKENPSNTMLINISNTLQIPITELIEDITDNERQALLSNVINDLVDATTKNAIEAVYNTVPGWTKVGFDEKFKNPHEFWSDVVFSYPSKFYDLSSLGLNDEEFDEAIEEISNILEIAYNLKVKEIFDRRNQKK
ncbi:helix-turn-helix domain-containing protein [Clostridium botulinum]|uniref:helix-turn-helix domain-containing protein n=1 Tax=Clostridium botulinum TaxID=1491 RepID=UPI000174E4C4|nr:helix-turn-helix transcriptional regulator [Clostridium botulinum]ACD51987.1 dna-binding protein [Clostridium botulinum E3 str. Alaska E43]MCR1159363.1 helix-turn-helix transcriptional regulator [Clostridium botulinum]